MSVSQDVRGAISGPRGDRHAALIGVAIIAVFWSLTGILIALNDGNPNSVPIAGLIVAGYSLPSAIAALATFRARRTTAGLERRTWRNLTIGLTLWTAGGVSYIVYLLLGGDLLEPTAWSQAGYLAAYPFWYLALWQLRQPVLAASRARQIETVVIEVAGLLMLGLVVASILRRYEVGRPSGSNRQGRGGAGDYRSALDALGRGPAPRKGPGLHPSRMGASGGGRRRR